MPNVAGWPASCREGFEGCRGGRFRRLSSKAAVRGLHVPEAPSPGFRKPIRTEEAGLGEEKRQACQERFGGSPKCLTLLAGLPAAEKGLRAAEVAGSGGSVLRLQCTGRGSLPRLRRRSRPKALGRV